MTLRSNLPETEVIDRLPMNRRSRYITAVHGPLPRSFSGSTLYCARAAIAEGVMEGAFALVTDKQFNWRVNTRAMMWKLLRKATRRPAGGYKFHPSYSNVLWSQFLPTVRDSVIVSNCQILGSYFFANATKLNVTPIFYIDGTLIEYLIGYGAVEDLNIGGDVVNRAIELERQGYEQASRIIAMSQATANNLIEAYGVSPDRISVVVPGSNIMDGEVPPPSDHTGWVGSEFTLGFVGLYPQRKGLDKLAAAVRILRSRGAPIRLRVIGQCPAAIASMDFVEYLGIINKETDTARFIEAIRSVDLGCQLSRAELTGIATMEFVRVGVPVLATNVGGIPDMFADGGGILVSPAITVEELATRLHALMMDMSRYQALRQAAVRRSQWASWRRVARELDALLPA
jgi:glycosyltransferase involved in cell wall biosynthesis